MTETYYNYPTLCGNDSPNITELIIEYENLDAINASLCSIGKVKYVFPSINSAILETDMDNIDDIKCLDGVKTVYPNKKIISQMYNSKKLVNYNTDRYTGKGIGIAILDTGISPIKDFSYPNNRIVAFQDFINSKKTPYDNNSHGTQVPY